MSVRRKVSEKSLELNVGAELLTLFRGRWGMPKAYLRGLTQAEEDREGADFYVELNPAARIFAFQFKAPRAGRESMPYRFTLRREQHTRLRQLARMAPNSVYYVFPFYITPVKLRQDVPHLLRDTWVLAVDAMRTAQTFGADQSRTIRCEAGIATVNPKFELFRFVDDARLNSQGIPVKAFAAWYGHRVHTERSVAEARGRDPWLIRGLKLVIVAP